MQVRELSWDEVVTAGTVIFGPSFGSFARAGAWRGELKTAYRRRALETHPDRAALLGRSEAELLREFRAVAEAYELLVQLRAGVVPEAPGPAPSAPTTPPRAPSRASRPPRAATPPPRAAPAPPPRAAPAREAARPQARRPAPACDPVPPPPAPGRARHRAAPSPGAGAAPPPGASAGAAPATGARATSAPAGARAASRIDWASKVLPRRRLRLAEFLYYAGLVPWSDFVGAVAWQRRQRPAVGRIAVDFGFLAGGDVWEILERRRREGGGEPFGEFAVRRGYLTPFQLLALLGQQLRLQRPIGRYFVERGLISDREIDDARAAVFRHNVRHPL